MNTRTTVPSTRRPLATIRSSRPDFEGLFSPDRASHWVANVVLHSNQAGSVPPSGHGLLKMARKSFRNPSIMIGDLKPVEQFAAATWLFIQEGNLEGARKASKEFSSACYNSIRLRSPETGNQARAIAQQLAPILAPHSIQLLPCLNL